MKKIKKPRNIEKLEETLTTYMNDYSLNLLEAIQMYCEEKAIDMETLAPLINKSPMLKETLYNQCKELNLVK